MPFVDESKVTDWTDRLKQYFFQLTSIIPIANGGTGASTAANARKNLGTPASSSLATVESSTATASHAKGSHFIVDGELKKATAAIASGEAITSSNSTTDTLQGQIDTLQDSVGKVRLSQSVNSKAVDFEMFATENDYMALIIKMASGKSYVLHINSGSQHFVLTSRNAAGVDTEIWHV